MSGLCGYCHVVGCDPRCPYAPDDEDEDVGDLRDAIARVRTTVDVFNHLRAHGQDDEENEEFYGDVALLASTAEKYAAAEAEMRSLAARWRADLNCRNRCMERCAREIEELLAVKGCD